MKDRVFAGRADRKIRLHREAIGEDDVIAFAHIPLASHPNHLDEAYAQANGLGAASCRARCWLA
ncbi:acyl dehydratase [Bradyrhizobium sp. F1.13.1]